MPSDGLRTPELLGRRPLIGLAMVVLGCVLFALLALGVETQAWVTLFDVQVANSLHGTALRSPALVRDVMISGFYVGEYVVLVIGLALAAYYLRKRFRPELAMVLIGWGGELALRVGLSLAFGRPRPQFAVPVWRPSTGQGFGFPSGHTFASVVCFGLLAYLLVPRIASRLGKAAVILAAVIVCVFVGYSRVFVGEHYLSDVLAGYALGISWAGLVYTSVELVSKRDRHRSE